MPGGVKLSFLVDWSEVRVGQDAHPYPPHGVWADPDLDHAAFDEDRNREPVYAVLARAG